jgi:preprotein translocase subunit SecB
MQPLFTIKSIFFPITYIVFNSEYKPKQYADTELDIHTNLRKVPRKKNTWEINLSVKTPSKMESATFPYEFFLSANGVFVHEPSASLTKEGVKRLKQLLYVNGSSILYSAVRERLLLLTGHAPYPKYCLPSYRFNPDEYDV